MQQLKPSEQAAIDAAILKPSKQAAIVAKQAAIVAKAAKSPTIAACLLGVN